MADEINVTTTEETVDEAPVKYTRNVCDIQVPDLDVIKDSDVIEFDAIASRMNRLEINHYLDNFMKRKKMCQEYHDIIYSSSDTIQSFKDLADSFQESQRDDVASKLHLQKCVVDLEEMQKEDKFDEEEAKKSLEEYDARLDIGIQILQKYLDKLKKEKPQYVLIDDITDTLSKNIASISSTENINKKFFTNGMQKVIDEINESQDKILDPYSRMENKLLNPKRTKDIVMYVYKNPDKAKKECESVAFTDDMLSQFLKFLITEKNYFVFVSDESASESGARGMLDVVRTKLNIEDEFDIYEFLTKVFFYHLAKISKANTKRMNYLSLIFKTYVLQAIELDARTKDMEEFRNFPEAFSLRSQLDSGDEKGKISANRQKIYVGYDKIFEKYISSLK